MGMVALFLVFLGLAVGTVPGALGVWVHRAAVRDGRGGAWWLFALLAVAGTLAVAVLGGWAALSYEYAPPDPPGAAGLTAANTFPILTAAFVVGLSPGLGLLVGALAVFKAPPAPPPPRGADGVAGDRPPP